MKNKINFTEDRRVSMIDASDTRRLLQMNVEACNCFLKQRIDQMSDESLLMNAHPLDRPWFAKELGIELHESTTG